MCEDNLDHTFAEMDDPQFEDFLVISPAKFSSTSYSEGEQAKYAFEFDGFSANQGDVIEARAFDVFDNVVTSSQAC